MRSEDGKVLEVLLQGAGVVDDPAGTHVQVAGFDRLPLADGTGDGTPEVFLDGPPRLLKDPVFVNYALLLEPGEYALSSFDVKVCWSSRPMNIDHFIAKRSDLIEGGYPKAGSFEVLPGEIVYIGNFWLDCYHEPMIWRYYTEGREGFRKHMAEIKQQYPFLDVDNAEYRLFSTTTMGQDYELPK